MPDYRAHLIGSDVHAYKLIVLDAPDDAAAIAAAKQSVDGHDVELWQLTTRSANSSGRKNNPEHLGDFLRTHTKGAAAAAESADRKLQRRPDQSYRLQRSRTTR
jgi:hypothetical protein